MQFSIGDRVRVTEEEQEVHLRGATGNVTVPPASVRDTLHEGNLWIEFDGDGIQQPNGFIIAYELPPFYLGPA